MYINKNRHGQSNHRNSTKPYNITINGVKVEWLGDASTKTFDIASQEGLISHSIKASYDKPYNAYCHSPEDAIRLAELLRENPNYTENKQ